MSSNTAALDKGVYSARLIVYNYETRASQGGTIEETGLRVEREYELGKLELRS